MRTINFANMSKKKSYIVYIKETSYGYVEVEAESPEEAEKLAEEQYMNGDIYWGDCDFEMTDPEEN